MQNKVVVITGGSSGIGRSLAIKFGLQGYYILITGRNKQELDSTVDGLRRRNIVVCSFQGDVGVESDNKKMVEVAIGRYGRIDVLINNAGISMNSTFEDLDLSVIRRVMDTNFYGTVYATSYCLPHIIKSKGSIIGISSIAGYRGLPARSGYSASKFAVNGFLEALRTEVQVKGVHVLIACPGFTSSNIRKKSLTKTGAIQGISPRTEGKMMTSQVCASYIYKAFVRRKKILILTGKGKITVFLNKWMPSLMDKLVYKEMAGEENSSLKYD